MEKQKKMYDGMNFDQRMEAVEMLQAAMEQVETARKAIDHFITTFGMELPEKNERNEQDLFGYEDLVEIVSDRMGICPLIIDAILDTAIHVLDEYTGEGDDDADEDN